MSRQQRRRDQRKGRQAAASSGQAKWIWWAGGGLVGAVVIVVVVLFAAGVFDSGGSSGDLTAAQQEQLVSEGHLIGDPDAPVTLIEFADFQCPFCREFWGGILPVIKTEYVDNGRANLYFHHMAFIGVESERAAMASECAADQGRFDDYHDILYLQQGPENKGYLSQGTLESFAEAIQLDVDAFSECLSSSTHLAEIRADTEHAGDAGIRSTPTLVVDGNFVENALNIAQVRKAIDDALEAAE